MSHRLRHRDAFGLIGWLFADMLLVLAVLFLASSTVARPPPPTPSPSPVPSQPATPTPTPTVAPTPSPAPRCRNTVILRKNELTIPPRVPGRRATDARIKVEFRRQYAGERVGLLLTFVHGTNPADGNRQAAQVNALIRKSFPKEVNGRTITEAYFNDSGSVGTIQFDVYLMANSCP